MDFISGFGPYNHRLKSLHGGLVRSFKKLLPTHPLIVARGVYQLSNSLHHILPLCFQSNYLSSYERLNASSEGNNLGWKPHLRNQLKLIHQTEASKFATLAYFNPHRTLKDNSSEIFNLKKHDFQTIVAWRLNLAHLHYPCCCFNTFNRSHLSCLLHNEEMYSETLNSQNFNEAKQTIQSNLNAKHYTPLDHLLNLNRYHDFLNLSSKLKSLLNDQSH